MKRGTIIKVGQRFLDAFFGLCVISLIDLHYPKVAQGVHIHRRYHQDFLILGFGFAVGSLTKLHLRSVGIGFQFRC